MHIGNQITLLYYFLSAMIDIWVSNKSVNLAFRLGRISERKQLLSHYLLLKQTRAENLRLTRFGFRKDQVDAKEFALLIRKCRSDTLHYLREERAIRQQTTQ